MMEINFAGLYLNNCNIWFDPPVMNYIGNKLPKKLQYAKTSYYEPYPEVNRYKNTHTNICDYAETDKLSLAQAIDELESPLDNQAYARKEGSEWIEVEPPVIELWMHGSNWNPNLFVFPWNITHPRINNSYKFNGVVMYSNWAWNFANMFSDCGNLNAPFGVPICTDVEDNMISYSLTPFLQHYINKSYDRWFYGIKQETDPYWGIYGRKFPWYNCAYMFANSNISTYYNSASGTSLFFDGGVYDAAWGLKNISFTGVGTMAELALPSVPDGRVFAFNNCQYMYYNTYFSTFGNLNIHASDVSHMFENARDGLGTVGHHVFNIKVTAGISTYMFANSLNNSKSAGSVGPIYSFDMTSAGNISYAFYNCNAEFDSRVDWNIFSDAVEAFANCGKFNCNTFLIGRKCTDEDAQIYMPIQINAAGMFKSVGRRIRQERTIRLTPGDTEITLNNTFNTKFRFYGAPTNINSMFMASGTFNSVVIIDNASGIYDWSYAFSDCSAFDGEIIIQAESPEHPECIFGGNMHHAFSGSKLTKSPFYCLNASAIATADLIGATGDPPAPILKWWNYSEYIENGMQSAPCTITGDTSFMFAQCYQLANMDTACSVENASNMFDHCNNLTQVNGSFTILNNAHGMFHACTNFNQDFQYATEISENWTAETEDISCMFDECKNYNHSLIIVENTINASYLFNGCKNLNVAPVFWGYSEGSPGQYFQNSVTVTDIDGMFRYCNNFNSSFLIPNGVVNARSLFYNSGITGKLFYFPPTLKNAQAMFSDLHTGGGIHIYPRTAMTSLPYELNVANIFEYSNGSSAPAFFVHGRSDTELAPFMRSGTESVTGKTMTWTPLNDGNGYQSTSYSYHIYLYNNL